MTLPFQFLFSILAQFRYSILPLSIETGRFQDIPIEYRYCLFCDDNLIESEYHFILHCTFYNELRFDFFNRVRQIDINFDWLNEDDKIRRIMKNDVIIIAADFLVKAFEKRQKTLYI